MSTPMRVLVTGSRGSWAGTLRAPAGRGGPGGRALGVGPLAGGAGAPGPVGPDRAVRPGRRRRNRRSPTGCAASSPRSIYHLAAQANPQASVADPRGTWALNLGGTLNLLEAVKAAGLKPRPRVVLVGSGVCYGNPGPSTCRSPRTARSGRTTRTRRARPRPTSWASSITWPTGPTW